MYEALSVLMRQVMLVWGTYLVATNRLDKGLLEPLIGAGLALFSVTWMTWVRFVSPFMTTSKAVVEDAMDKIQDKM